MFSRTITKLTAKKSRWKTVYVQETKTHTMGPDKLYRLFYFERHQNFPYTMKMNSKKKIKTGSKVKRIFKRLKSADKKRMWTLLQLLSKIIIKYPVEHEYFRKNNCQVKLLQYLGKDNATTNLCICILQNSIKDDKKARDLLANRNVFHQLLFHLEMNKSTQKFRNYASLIMFLVDNNSSAQNLFRDSGCLSCFMVTLKSLLEAKQVASSKIDVTVNAIASCLRNPVNKLNQSTVGWLVPQIISVLQNRINNSLCLDTMRSLWSLLRDMLHDHETNQELFIQSSGLDVLFRSLECLNGGKKTDEQEDELRRSSGLLRTLRYKPDAQQHALNHIPTLVTLVQHPNCFVLWNTLQFIDVLIAADPATARRLQTDSSYITALHEVQRTSQKENISALCARLVQQVEQRGRERNELQSPVSNSPPSPSYTRQCSPTKAEFTPCSDCKKNSADYHRSLLRKAEQSLREKVLFLPKGKRRERSPQPHILTRIAATPRKVMGYVWGFLSGKAEPRARDRLDVIRESHMALRKTLSSRVQETPSNSLLYNF